MWDSAKSQRVAFAATSSKRKRSWWLWRKIMTSHYPPKWDDKCVKLFKFSSSLVTRLSWRLLRFSLFPLLCVRPVKLYFNKNLTSSELLTRKSCFLLSVPSTQKTQFFVSPPRLHAKDECNKNWNPFSRYTTPFPAFVMRSGMNKTQNSGAGSRNV